MIELAVFDLDRLRVAAQTDLPNCLRQITAAIESGDVEARLLRCVPHGFSDIRDRRAHVLLDLDLAVEIRKLVQVPEGLLEDEGEENGIGMG